MKAGELYDVAQLIIPSITKRMFTVFYNISMEHLSRILRINILEERGISTVAGYKDLPLSAVRIERVSGTAEGIYKWDIVNNELILYLPNGSGEYEAVTNLGTNTVTIKYWALIKNALAEIDANGKVKDSDPEINWVDQDDENDSDVQICAVYMAMEEAASIIGATKEELDSIRGNFKQYIQRLYIKYNTSVIYQALKQVSF
jgi:hypothetical protein